MEVFIIKKHIISIISFLATIGCVIAYEVIGSTVQPDGMLSEPFYLIPLTYFFLTIAVISTIFSLIKNKRKALVK